MTSPTSSTAPYSPSPTAFGFCSALFGAALAVILELVAAKTLGMDVGVNGALGLTFMGMAVGGSSGAVASVMLRRQRPDLAVVMARMIYVLTLFTVPFLLYLIGVLVFIESFQSYQF